MIYVIDITEKKLNVTNSYCHMYYYMINKETEYIYNIILYIFLGILIALSIDNMFEKPRIYNVYKK